MEQVQTQQALTPEQEAAVLLALKDPEKKRQVIAILKAAGQLLE